MLLIITMLHKLRVNKHHPTQVPTALLKIIKSTNATKVVAEKMDRIPAIQLQPNCPAQTRETR